MPPFAYSPWIDPPLVALAITIFISHFCTWSKIQNDEIPVDLESRLTRANIKVTLLFCGILLVCWLCNVAVWIVFTAFFLTLIVLASVSGGNVAANGIMAFSFTIVREWAFGFPELILHPPVVERKNEESDMIGKQGKVLAPLRPCGEVKIGDEVISVVSEEGIQIDKGTHVIITGRRNDRYCVRVAEA